MKKFLRTPSRRNPGSRRSACGFSLVELVTVIIILGIVASGGALIMSRGFNVYFAGRDITRADWNGRLALERMTRDLREVRAPADITTMTATQIAYTDIFGSAVSYTRAGTTLTRNGTPLANNISAFNLSYLQRNGQSAAASASAVYYITVSAVATSYNNISVTYHNTVKPRSFP